MSKLPKNWRVIEQDGVTLYWTRCCANYLILPIRPHDGGPITAYQWEWQWHAMGTVDSLQEALLACREHLDSRATLAPPELSDQRL